ncbi:MAG: hypothetical protein LUG61_00440 [Lachnospiraceae bacterium]|nr:hypothetical protein [Lachnospiraceae bacterium]
MTKNNSLKKTGKFLAITVPLGAAGGLLLWGVSQLKIGQETIHTYDENGEEHIRKIRRRPFVWLFAFLEWLPSPWPWSRTRRQGTSCEEMKQQQQAAGAEPEFTEGEEPL